MSQHDAAEGAGISQSEWQKLETEQTKRIGLRTARRLVAFMEGEITLDDLDPTEPESGPLPDAGDDEVHTPQAG